MGTLLGLAALLGHLWAVCLVTLLRLTGSNQRQVIHSSELYIWKVTYESYLSNQLMYNCSFENYCSTEVDNIHNAYRYFITFQYMIECKKLAQAHYRCQTSVWFLTTLYQ